MKGSIRNRKKAIWSYGPKTRQCLKDETLRNSKIIEENNHFSIFKCPRFPSMMVIGI